MAVLKDAFIPEKKGDTNPDPDTRKAGETGPGYYKKKAEEARARLDYVEAESLIDRARAGPAAPAESPIQIKGSVNLGDFDLQAQGREAAETLKQERADSNTRLAAAEAEARKAKDDLATANLEHLRQDFSTKFASLQDAVMKGNTSQKSFAEQYKELTETATLLGLSPGGGVGGGGGGGTMQIEILKMQHQMKMDERNFQREMRKDDKAWQLELKKMEREDKRAQEKLEAEKERNALLYSIPERIGGALGEAVVNGATAEPSGGQVSAAPAKQYHIEAPVGDAGELDCPKCHSKIGFGPTSAGAECVKCHLKLSIKRTPAVQHVETAKEDPASTGEIAGAEPAFTGGEEE